MSSGPTFNHSILFDDPDRFFALDGDGVMKLTIPAAIALCRICTERGLIVRRLEGFRLHPPYFESRLDAIWDGDEASWDAAEENEAAVRFIEMCAREDGIGAFIITLE